MTTASDLADRLQGLDGIRENGHTESARADAAYQFANAIEANLPLILSSLRRVEKLERLTRIMVEAIDGGDVDSRELDGEPEVGIPPHKWHEEWVYNARQALTGEAQ